MNNKQVNQAEREVALRTRYETRWMLGLSFLALTLTVFILVKVINLKSDLEEIQSDFQQMHTTYQVALADHIEWAKGIERAISEME